MRVLFVTNVIAKLVFSFDIVFVMSASRYLRKEKVGQECDVFVRK